LNPKDLHIYSQWTFCLFGRKTHFRSRRLRNWKVAIHNLCQCFACKKK